MTNIDQFESAFRAAAKPTFELAPPQIDAALVLCDLSADEAALFAGTVKTWLARAFGCEVTLETIDGGGFTTAKDVLDLVEDRRPQLVVTYRNLHSEAWRWPFSLGEHLDVLCQAADTPVLILPHPEAGRASEYILDNADKVMAITDHLAGDAHLINHAARFVEAAGTLILAHIEDQRVFERYLEVIGKIPTIDTGPAAEAIQTQLLKEASDYIDATRAAVDASDVELTVEARVQVGRHLADYKTLIESEEIDLLVMSAKDEDQLAMHGLAYPLAVELRNIPLLLL